jgi:uncharacterized phage-like protein YoqJ
LSEQPDADPDLKKAAGDWANSFLNGEGGRKMTEEEKRLRRCCFTGHRASKLDESETQVRKWLEDRIDEAVADGKTTFLTGMGMGVDLWAAEIVLARKKTNDALRLIAVTPYLSFDARWKEEWKKRYTEVWKAADYRVTMADRYDENALERRNRWLVDHSSLVIAFYNGEAGSTKRTVDYAREKGVKTVVCLDGVKAVTEPYPECLLHHLEEDRQWPEDIELRLAIELFSGRSLTEAEVIEKRFMEGKPLEEVAQETGLTEDQTRQTIAKAKKRLKLALPFLRGDPPETDQQKKKEWLLARIHGVKSK